MKYLGIMSLDYDVYDIETAKEILNNLEQSVLQFKLINNLIIYVSHQIYDELVDDDTFKFIKPILKKFNFKETLHNYPIDTGEIIYYTYINDKHYDWYVYIDPLVMTCNPIKINELIDKLDLHNLDEIQTFGMTIDDDLDNIKFKTLILSRTNFILYVSKNKSLLETKETDKVLIPIY